MTFESFEEKIKRYLDNAEYERTHGNLQGCLEFKQLADWLKELKQLREQTRLIPVSERLPEQDRKDEAGNDVAYLIQTEWGTFFTATYDGNWCHVDSSVLVESDVVAWMPLPEPYKAESEDVE